MSPTRGRSDDSATRSGLVRLAALGDDPPQRVGPHGVVSGASITFGMTSETVFSRPGPGITVVVDSNGANRRTFPATLPKKMP